MTKEELDFIGSMNMCDEISNEAYKKIVCHCEDQQPCEDAISRKDMLAVFSQSHSLTQAWDGFEKLPPIIPKEKTGRWIERKLPMMIHDWKCDQCRMVTNERTNFCPNCGARMVSE